MSRQRLNRESLRKKRKLRRLVLLVVLIAAVLNTGIIALCSYLSTNVYQNESEFREYADAQLERQIFKVKNTEKISYEYGTPISYVVDYDVCDDEFIEAFRNDKINELKLRFSEAKKAEEDKRAEEHREDKRYKPLEHALIIESAVYKSSRGVTSLVIYESGNSESGRDMTGTGSEVYTYQFSAKTDVGMIPQQIFSEDYREKCSEYFTRYFKKQYKKEELSEGWKEYVSANENNFNKYMVTDIGVTFFFDEGTILDKSEGIVCAGISEKELGGSLRQQVEERYIDAKKPMVALTYDDGPGGDSENRIIQCLKRNGGVATFFYLGSRVGENRDKVKAACDMGCEIGAHTWSHPVLTGLDEKQLIHQLGDTNNAIKEACGEYPTLFRPSYGETNKKINDKSGLPVVMWSVDTLDWKRMDGKKVFDYVSGLSSLDGKIILLHSIHDSTADATELIVPWLKEQGYQMVTVSELVKYKQGEEMQAGKVYW